MSMAYYFAAHFNVLNTHMSDNAISSTTPPLRTSPTGGQTHHSTTPSKRLPTSSQKQSIFFLLPAELRNQIYDYLLCANTPSSNSLVEYSQQRSHAPQPIYPAILATCKRIHQEAQDLLYSTHIFQAHPSLLTSLPHLVSPWKPLLDASAIAKIRRWYLSVRLDTDPRFTEKQATAAFSGAEYLEIHAWQSMFDGCDDGVLRLFAGIRGVRVARVTGCAKGEFAAWLEGQMMRPIEEEMEVEESCSCAKGVCGKCGERIVCEEKVVPWIDQERDVWTFGNR